jgi:uncharacterized protein (DUF1499 family)
VRIGVLILTWLVGILASLAVLLVVAGQLGWLQGTPPADLGVRDGRLKPPSGTPNSVSSQAALYPDHPQRIYADIAPFPVRGDGPATLARIRKVVAGMPGARVVRSDPAYLYAQFTTPLLKFVDDVEFWFDPVANVIHVRSASRIGRGDLGENRRRIEAIRILLAAGR